MAVSLFSCRPQPQTPSPIDVGTISELFISRQMVREATSFLLEALAGDRPEQAPLQSKLLEINLISNPAVGGHLTSDPFFFQSFFFPIQVLIKRLEAGQCSRVKLQGESGAGTLA